MQVFGLSGHISRNGRGRRVFSPRSPRPSTAAKKRDAMARWRQAMGHGFSAEQAAEAVAVPRSTLYPWHSRRSRARSGRDGRRRKPRRRRWSRRSRACASTIPCGAGPSSVRS